MSRTALSRLRQPSWPFLLHTVLGGGNVILPIVKTRKLRPGEVICRSHKASKSRLEPRASDSKALALVRSPCREVCLPSPENSDCHVWCGIPNHTVKHAVLDVCSKSPSPTQNTLISFVTVVPNQMSGARGRSTHGDFSEDRKGGWARATCCLRSAPSLLPTIPSIRAAPFLQVRTPCSKKTATTSALLDGPTSCLTPCMRGNSQTGWPSGSSRAEQMKMPGRCP